MYMVYMKHSDGGSSIYVESFFTTREAAEAHAASNNERRMNEWTMFGYHECFVRECTTRG
jgi:hypothetical protein